MQCDPMPRLCVLYLAISAAKFAPKQHKTFANVGWKFRQKYKPSRNSQRLLNILPKWQNFAQSGHTGHMKASLSISITFFCWCTWVIIEPAELLYKVVLLLSHQSFNKLLNSLISDNYPQRTIWINDHMVCWIIFLKHCFFDNKQYWHFNDLLKLYLSELYQCKQLKYVLAWSNVTTITHV